jgi:menaquinone-dependent protoporphyrinogen oxidase
MAMRVLVTWGSKHGGTEGIARMLAEALQAHGFDVVATPAYVATDLEGFRAVIVGGALYANRWPAEVRRFVNRHLKQLRAVPVWFFSSGPLDESAEGGDIPPAPQVAVLAERVGAKSHVTFGGRLEADAKGFPASAMAKKMSGDWRNPHQIRAWAAQLADELPRARPGTPVEPPARSIPRLVTYAVAGWALCAATMAAFVPLAGIGTALLAHGIAAPLFFTALAWSYFRVPGARDPLPTAVAWIAIVALLDLLVVAGLVERSFDMFRSVGGTWLPFALIFLVTWVVGNLASAIPTKRNAEETAS